MVEISRWRNQINSLTSRAQGQHYEELAKRYFLSQGLQFVAKNVVCRRGEIDLIMKEPDDTLVFIEVRYRKNAAFGDAAESISPLKQNRIFAAAREWLQKMALNESETSCRFDVFIATNHEKQWIKNALSFDESRR